MVDPDEPTESVSPLAMSEAPPDADARPPIETPSSVGRYVLQERLGEGGFGAVHAAHDPKLDRRVAVKLLRPRAARDVDALRRLVREARALAALDHPNVVAVYDVGTFGDDPLPHFFIVMELVRGQSLHQWLQTGARPAAEVLPILRAAGRGLAAAHAAGIIHRDFKPGNVLVGDDGRTKVADFGLARSATWPESGGRDGSRASDLPSGETALEDVTQHGVVMGTPSYMAPEQLEHGTADARSDQFAFCVTAWQALMSQLPFPRRLSPRRRLAAIRAGPEAPPRRRGVSARVRRALQRGLAFDPADRFDDMPQLLAALKPRASRRTMFVAGGALVVAAAATWSALPRRTSRCADTDAHLQGVWDEARRGAIRRGFEATGLGYAPASAERTIARLDAQAEAWTDAWTDACSRVEDATDATADRELSCLRHLRTELDALAGVLAGADAGVVERAASLSAGLHATTTCTEREQSVADLSSAARAVEEPLRTRLVTARIRGDAGRFDAALDELSEIESEAEAAGLSALAMEARAERGILLGKAGRYREAAELDATTYFAARDADRPRLAARLAIDLVVAHGLRLADTDAGLTWARHAEASISRAGDPADLRASLDWHVGTVHFRRGELDAAQASFERAVTRLEQAGDGATSGIVGKILNNLASVQLGQGHVEEAAATFERSIANAERTLGPHHPDVAKTLNNLALARSRLGDLEGALRDAEHALEVAKIALGPRHPTTLTTANNLGELSIRAGHFAEAEARLLEALAGREAALGPDHVDVAVTLNNLALARLRLGRADQALPSLLRSLEIHEMQAKVDDARLGALQHNLGEAHLAAGRLDEARDAFAAAQTHLVAAFGPDTAMSALPKMGEGLVAQARGDLPTAIAELQDALALADQLAVPADAARIRFALARALGSRDPKRATTLAAEAARAWRAAGPGWAAQADEAAAWSPPRR